METERAIRARSNVMTPDDIDSIDVVLREHDLAYPVDYREQQSRCLMPNPVPPSASRMLSTCAANGLAPVWHKTHLPI
jgi:hypothetical protein